MGNVRLGPTTTSLVPRKPRRLMENSEVLGNVEVSGDGRNSISTAAAASTSSAAAAAAVGRDPAYKLFGRESSVHHMMGGGTAADVILWRRRHVSCGIIVAATVAWFLLERSGLSFLSMCSDVSLILVVLLFVRANYAVISNKQLDTLPELVLSEEMVNNAAASFRVKINYTLLVAHDITLGKDFKIFFKVVISLWLLSVIGSLVSFFSLSYIGIITFITIPALYNKFEDHVDRYAGMVHQKISKHYKVVDESLMRRLPRNLPKDKDS